MLSTAHSVYVLADAHIGAASDDAERHLLSFLKWLPADAGGLVINGDLFEFWFEWHRVIPRRGFRVLAALADVVAAGIPVLWIAGNHDCWGGEVLRADVGVTYHVGTWRGKLAGWETRIDHGDGLRDQADRKYRAVRRVLRHPWAVWSFGHLLHPDWASALAGRTSHASRTYVPGDGGTGLRDVAFDVLTGDPSLDLVIFGHSHVRALERAASGGVYANPGAWMSECTYLRIEAARVELRRWNGSAESDRLDVLDRGAEKALTDA